MQRDNVTSGQKTNAPLKDIINEASDSTRARCPEPTTLRAIDIPKWFAINALDAALMIVIISIISVITTIASVN